MIWMRRLRVILNKFFIKYLVGCLGSDKYQDMYYCEASYNCWRMFKKSLEFQNLIYFCLVTTLTIFRQGKKESAATPK